jgi:hypothetical protein
LLGFKTTESGGFWGQLINLNESFISLHVLNRWQVRFNDFVYYF